MVATPPRRSSLLVGLLTVLLLVVVATNAILLHDRRDDTEVRDLRPADVGARGWADSSAGRAVRAARTAATTYFTIDHRTVRRDMDRMRRLGTPDFVARYDVAATALADRITEERLRLSGRLPRDGTATEYVVSDRALVLVSVDVTTARGTTRYRTRVALDLVDGRWRVAALDEVS